MNTSHKTKETPQWLDLQGLNLRANFPDDIIEDLHSLECESHSNPWSMELIREEFRNPASLRFSVLDSNETLIAYIFNHLVEDELHVLNLTVAPAFRRSGIGRYLLAESVRAARAQGAKRALLEVRPSNTPAVGLYRAIGFKIIAKRKQYYSDNREDALMLELELSQDLPILR